MTDDFDAHYQKLDGIARTGAREAEAIHLLRGLGYSVTPPRTPVDVAAILARYEAGETTLVIAASVGLHSSTIAAMVRRNGGAVRPKGYRGRKGWRARKQESAQ